MSGDPAPVREPSEALNGESAGHEAHVSDVATSIAMAAAAQSPRRSQAIKAGAEGIRVGSPSTARPATRGSTTRSTIHHVAGTATMAVANASQNC